MKWSCICLFEVFTVKFAENVTRHSCHRNLPAWQHSCSMFLIVTWFPPHPKYPPKLSSNFIYCLLHCLFCLAVVADMSEITMTPGPGCVGGDKQHDGLGSGIFKWVVWGAYQLSECYQLVVGQRIPGNGDPCTYAGLCSAVDRVRRKIYFSHIKKNNAGPVMGCGVGSGLKAEPIQPP